MSVSPRTCTMDPYQAHRRWAGERGGGKRLGNWGDFEDKPPTSPAHQYSHLPRGCPKPINYFSDVLFQRRNVQTTCSYEEEELQCAQQMHVGASPHTTTMLTYSSSSVQDQKPASNISQAGLTQHFTDSLPATHKKWMVWVIEEIHISMGLKKQAWFFGSWAGPKTTLSIAYPNN